MTLYPIEGGLRNAFLPDFLKGSPAQIPGRAVTGIPVKQDGIALPDPTQTSGANWTKSYVVTGKLIIAPQGTAEFC